MDQMGGHRRLDLAQPALAQGRRELSLGDADEGLELFGWPTDVTPRPREGVGDGLGRQIDDKPSAGTQVAHGQLGPVAQRPARHGPRATEHGVMAAKAIVAARLERQHLDVLESGLGDRLGRAPVGFDDAHEPIVAGELHQSGGVFHQRRRHEKDALISSRLEPFYGLAEPRVIKG